MEARVVDALPTGSGWQFEPKWDGFRCLTFRDRENISLRSKSGTELARYFPDIVAALREIEPKRFVVDGELVIPVGGTLSFEELQLRLHPAESRVRKLAAEKPAVLIVFDLLQTPSGKNLISVPLRERRAALEDLFAQFNDHPTFRISPYSRNISDARKWLDSAGGALDGVIAKKVDGAYHPGERDMLKIKRLRTADCVIGGFRYAQDSKQVGSLLLGLYNDDGKLDHVGFCSGIPNATRGELTKRLEELRKPPGFTGKSPGGPSRWSTERTETWEPLEPKLVAEVRYDHITDHRFRHGTKFMRWRPDKAPKQCTFDQLGLDAKPSKLIAKLIGGGLPKKRA
jgi:ATP-dependent DNA ligase